MAKKKKSKKFRLDFLNTILAVIAIFISGISIYYSYEIARKSGSFDKGVVQLNFSGYPLNQNEKYDVFYGLEISKKNLNFSNIPIEVINTGQKSLKNVKIIYQYPLIANLTVSDSIFTLSAPLIEGFNRKEISAKPYKQIGYFLRTIDPNFNHKIGDLISINESTIINTSTIVNSQDSIQMNVNSNLIFSIPTQISVSADDTKSNMYQLDLNFRNETDLNKLIKEIVEEKIRTIENDDFIPNFFITIPITENSIPSKGVNVNILNSDYSNTLLFKFDKTLKSLSKINHDGSYELIRIIK